MSAGAERINRGQVEWLASMMSGGGYDLRDEAFEEIVAKEFAAGLRSALANPARLYGHRTETMFGYVASALGGCEIVRREDAGQSFALPEGVVVPDMKLVLRDGRRVLVEVKNVHLEGFDGKCTIKRRYGDGLRRYASMTGCEVLVAIYWHGPNLWTLVPVDAFEDCDGNALDLKESMFLNRMSQLGDFHLGTVPPLACRISGTNGSGLTVDRPHMSIERVTSGGEPIDSVVERRIAWLLMMHGSWEVARSTPIFEGESVVAVDFTVEPQEWPEEQGFALAGALSSIISSRLRELTSTDGHVRSLSPRATPDELAVGVPLEYDGAELKLWRIVQQPSNLP